MTPEPDPLPPELLALEQALFATRAPLPAALRGRVLSAARKRAAQVRALPTPWFAALAAAAAALLIALSGVASIELPRDPAPLDPCARVRALHLDPAGCADGPG